MSAAVALHPIGAAAARAIADGRRPDDVTVAEDYPTEFSRGVAFAAGREGQVGPFFVEVDGGVVGEIGGAIVGERTVELGYAIVASRWGRGHATAAVRAFADRAREDAAIDELVAHAPLDRPQSARVLEKAGFTPGDELDDDGMRVRRWELSVAG